MAGSYDDRNTKDLVMFATGKQREMNPVLSLLPAFDTVQGPSLGNDATYSEWAFPSQ